MPYPPFKNENYSNVGGLDRKASLYMLQSGEVLDLLNFDFTTPGAFTTRPGTTYYLRGASGMIPSFTEFSRLNGSSWKIWNIENLLLSRGGGATPSILRYMGNTFGSSALGFTYIPTLQNRLDFAPFVDRLFVAGAMGGQGAATSDFFKTDGTNTYKYSMPPGFAPSSASIFGSGTGFTGWYQYATAYVNERGYLGPVGSILNVAVAGYTSVTLNLVDPNTYSGAANIISDQYGATAQVIFRAGPFDSPSGTAPTFIGNLFALETIPLNSLSYTDFGSTLGPRTATGSTPASNALWFTLAPRYIDVFNNSLLAFGFSSLPSTFYVSRLGEPEFMGATASFEVRTNDGDRLTGGINYRGSEVLFKLKSFHEFSGDSFDNYSLRQISDQYGCVSNRACATFKDLLFFLDEKGVVVYNGNSPDVISTRIEPTFKRMNVPAAIDNAIMRHVKERNEVWTAFPIDGATMNNYLAVFDYQANAWSEWFGPQIASLALASDPNNKVYPHYGDYTGSIHWFSPTFASDSGRGFTFSVTPRFFGDLGYSVTKQFRRLYFDLISSQNSGVTKLLSIDLFADMNLNQVVKSYTLAISSSMPQQNRIDFGVPAKTMTYRMTGLSQDSPLQFPGFTVEYRYQRNV